MHEVGLTASGQLVGDAVPDELLVEGADFRLDRIAVGRRRQEMMLRSRAPMSENCSVRGMGVAVRVSTSTVARSVLSLSLDRHPELLLLVDDEQAEVLPFDPLAHDGVRADQGCRSPRPRAP